VLLLVAAGLGAVSFPLFSGVIAEGAGIWSAALAAVLCYAAAIADKAFSLNLLSDLARRVVLSLVPPLALIFLVLGTIFLGVATATEGGAMGAAGAMALAAARGRLDRRTLSDALQATTLLSCFVMFILIGSRIFSLTFYGINGHIWVEELFLGVPGGVWGFLLAVNLLVFILGCFLDFFEIAFIVVPLLAPVAAALGIDLVWFGIILAMNLQTSFLTPPFGFALFYMRSVAPAQAYADKVTGRTIAGVTTGEIYRGAANFIVLQVVMIVVVVMFPGLVISEQPPPVDPASIDIVIPEQAPGGGESLDGVPPPPSFD
jgi:tripartite ATP-independent transporter DctM subunit